MRALWTAVAVLIVGSAFALAQTTNQQDSPAPNSTAGTYSGNTPANTPDNDGTISRAPANNAGATPHSNGTSHNWGWIGIIGLAGLAGLRNRNRPAGASVRASGTTEPYSSTTSRGAAA